MKAIKVMSYTILVVVSLFVSIESMAHVRNTEMPMLSFQSTSTMAGSGSAYTSTPALNADGTAYVPYSTTSESRPSGPRKASAFDDDDEDMPIGDGMWLLMALGMGYAVWRGMRKSLVRE